MIISSHKIFSNSIFSFNGDKLFYTLQERTDLQECMANLILKALHAKGTNFLGQYETNSSTKKTNTIYKTHQQPKCRSALVSKFDPYY